MDAAAVFAQGWLAMAGLIVAIGAQNALVLRVGLQGGHVAAVVAFCTVSDVTLVMLGVFGLGALAAASAPLMEALRYAGATFLLWLAWRAFQRARRGGIVLSASGRPPALAATLATTAALTWLNPHVYLDTVVLMGAVAAQHGPALRLPFALGASLASAMWFASLGWGAAALGPRLATPRAWRAIDSIVALVMAALGLQLLLLGITP
jgi:L-lysine exporter family protein LysE/ArgO